MDTHQDWKEIHMDEGTLTNDVCLQTNTSVWIFTLIKVRLAAAATTLCGPFLALALTIFTTNFEALFELTTESGDAIQ